MPILCKCIILKLGIAERACDWIAHKISKIPHTKKNINDSSAI